MPRTLPLVPLLMLALGTPAAARTAPVEVTRFHLQTALTPGPVAPASGDDRSLEGEAYRAAVADEFARVGFAPATDARSARYTFTTTVTSETRVAPRRRSPFSIGLGVGGGSGGYRGGGVGVGVGANVGLGGSRAGEERVTRLAVQLLDPTGRPVWEGRAETAERVSRRPAAPVAERLAAALFAGFPGESGRTIRVR